MKLKTSKDEIVYLLEKVFEKYESQTGAHVVRNTNRKNYEGVARLLSDISNELPQTATLLQHDPYPADYNPKNQEYPFRKYDITGSQVKDAYMGIVNNPRPFLVDACYIYLYGTGRKGFEKNPLDLNLISEQENADDVDAGLVRQQRDELKSQLNQLLEEKSVLKDSRNSSTARTKPVIMFALVAAVIALGFSLYQWRSARNEWSTIRKDMNILPYQPTQAEIDSLEGIWLCYTGSPQARISDPGRYHMVVPNVLDVKYKNGYFTFTRYGASFDHVGYMQFESPWLVSIHSNVRNNDSIQSPRHSLMRLDRESNLVPVISASWNFDVGDRNNIIGIREVYIKQGKGGVLKEVMNTIENASCRCKIVQWTRDGNKIRTFNLRNQQLDTLSIESLKNLIDDKSILLRVPTAGMIIADTGRVGN